jgi:GNAT superfamily N-acetyltransferase
MVMENFVNKVRLIREDELKSLLLLYDYLNLDDPVLEVNESLKKLWNSIISHPDYFYLAAEEDGMLVSTCNLTIVKNLTRCARPYGLIENVVTHPHYRKKGFGTAVLKKAIQIAREHDCYKVMLLTSQKDDNTLNFYENSGFNREEKTGFIIRI